VSRESTLATTGVRNSVLIFGFASFFLFLALTFLLACCTPCLAMLAGAGAGWLTAYWTRPGTQDDAVRVGALSGALSGLGALVGQVVGAILSARLMTPEMIDEAYDVVADLFQSLGPEGLEGFQVPSTEIVTRISIITQAGCGLFNVAIMAGLGALAGLLYFRYRGRRSEPPGGLDSLTQQDEWTGAHED
jgi:hypothetical protein